MSLVRMRIVVLDGYTLNPGDNPWDEIAELGELTVYERTPPELVRERARDADIVLTNKTRLSAATLSELPRLKFISVLATGYDVVDVQAARERGILVANVPEYSTHSVAQHTFALLLELCNRVGQHDAAVRAGEWQRCADFSFWLQSPRELHGLIFGIVGLGRIGRRVAEIALAFGMKVCATGPREPRPLPATIEWTNLADLAGKADVVSLHCPLTPENEGFVNREFLSRMKPTAFLINTARGRLVDEHALADALRSGSIAGAAVDVIREEPMPANHPLLTTPNCIITPHMAWASLAARRRLMQTTAANIRAFLDGKPINLVS